MTDYMTEEEIRNHAAGLLPLLDAVIEHSRTLDLMSVKVYVQGSTWRRLKRLVLRLLRKKWGERRVVEYAGYTFFGEEGSEIFGVIYVDDGVIKIATPYQPALRQQTDLYVAHSPLDYVRVGLADNLVATHAEALRNITDARYAIERLLPDGHPLKQQERPQRPIAAPTDSTVTN